MTLLLRDSMGDTYTAAEANTLMGWSGAPNSLVAGRVAGNAHRNSTGGGSKNFASSADATAHAGFRFSSLNGQRRLFSLREGNSTHVDVRVNTDGSVVVTRNGTQIGSATPAGAMAINTWYHVGLYVKVHDSAGEFKLWIDKAAGDSPTVSGTGLDTRNGGTGVLDNFDEGAPGTNNGTVDTDDLHIWSGDDFKGDTRVIGQVASGAGAHAEWTPSAGANIDNVDEATQDGDTTYNSDATAGHRDTFTFPGLGVGSGSLVYAVCPYVIARKDDAGTRNVALVVRRGGTDYDGSSRALSTGYASYGDAWTADPSTSAAWTVTGVNAGEYGYKDA